MRKYLGCLVVLGCAAIAGAQTQPYALISPETAAQMKALGSSDMAHKILSSAGDQAKATPVPVAHVHTQGTLPHQGIRDGSIVAERDWDRMLNLGLAYRLSGGEPKYLDGETKFLAAWMAVYKPDLNPIDETRLEMVFLAFDLTRADLPAKVQADSLVLFASMADGYLEFVEKHPCGKNAENWQSHRIKLATLAAYELGDARRIARAKKAFETQVGCNVRPDGSVEDFYKRDALHYVVYDLEPLLTASLAAKAHGEDWFHFKSRSGSSVAAAVDWLLPYASGAKTHEEFVHSSVAFDAARDKAGEKGYSGQWDAKGAVTTLALAAVLDAKYAPALQQLTERTGTRPAPWIELLTPPKP